MQSFVALLSKYSMLQNDTQKTCISDYIIVNEIRNIINYLMTTEMSADMITLTIYNVDVYFLFEHTKYTI